MTNQLLIQKKYRKKYISNIYDSLQKKISDTVFLVESYDNICLDCSAYYVEITFIEKNSCFHNYELNNNPLFELSLAVRKSNNWNKSPAKYGTDKVFGGGHTFYTVLYPNGQILSMYMREWLPKQFRMNDTK